MPRTSSSLNSLTLVSTAVQILRPNTTVLCTLKVILILVHDPSFRVYSCCTSWWRARPDLAYYVRSSIIFPSGRPSQMISICSNSTTGFITKAIDALALPPISPRSSSFCFYKTGSCISAINAACMDTYGA